MIEFSNVTGILSSAFGASPRTVAITPPTSGNMLAVTLYFNNATTGHGVTDDQANTYTQVHSLTNADGGGVTMWRSDNLTGTMPTSLSITWTSGGSKFAYVLMAEMSGVDGTDPVDTTATSSTGFGETETVAFTTTENDNEALFAYVYNTGGGRDYSITEAGYSRFPAGVVTSSTIYNSDLGTAGGENLTLTWTTAANCNIGLVTFNPAGAGGPTTFPMYAYAQQ